MSDRGEGKCNFMQPVYGCRFSFTVKSLTFNESRMYRPPWPMGPNTFKTVRFVSTPGWRRGTRSLGR